MVLYHATLIADVVCLLCDLPLQIQCRGEVWDVCLGWLKRYLKETVFSLLKRYLKEKSFSHKILMFKLKGSVGRQSALM